MALVGHPSDLRSFAQHCALTHRACLSHETSLFFLLMLFSKCVTSSTQVPWGLEGFSLWQSGWVPGCTHGLWLNDLCSYPGLALN